MKNCQLIIFVILFQFLSCQNNEKKGEINIINDEAEKIYYKLDILDSEVDCIYQIDEKGRCSVLMTNKVYIDNKYFGPFDQVHKAVQKVELESKDSVIERIVQKTTISIKNKKNTYEEIWSFENVIYINPDGYGFYDIKIKLEDGLTKYKNESVYCLKIIFTEIDNGEGAITRTLMYNKSNGIWKLIKRSKLNTKNRTYTEEEFDQDHKDYDCDLGHSENKIRISLLCLIE